MRAYRIARWAEFYEPKKRDSGGVGPLPYVRCWVRGHTHRGEEYAHLFTLAADPGIAAAAFGLFVKLLEIAADQPRTRRDGVIRFMGRPASFSNLLTQTRLPAGLLGSCLDLLTHPEMCWVEQFEVDDATTSRPCQGLDASTAQSRRGHDGLAHQVTGTETETVTENITGTETETETADDSEKMCGVNTCSVSDPGQADEDPATLPEGHCGVRATLRVRLLDRFGIRLPANGDKTPRAKQAVADDQTLWRIACAVVVAPDKATAEQQALSVINTANQTLTRLPDKRLPAFISLCKERYPAVAAMWPEKTNRTPPGSATQPTGSPPSLPAPANSSFAGGARVLRSAEQSPAEPGTPIMKSSPDPQVAVPSG